MSKSTRNTAPFERTTYEAWFTQYGRWVFLGVRDCEDDANALVSDFGAWRVVRCTRTIADGAGELSETPKRRRGGGKA